MWCHSALCLAGPPLYTILSPLWELPLAGREEKNTCALSRGSSTHPVCKALISEVLGHGSVVDRASHSPQEFLTPAPQKWGGCFCPQLMEMKLLGTPLGAGCGTPGDTPGKGVPMSLFLGCFLGNEGINVRGKGCPTVTPAETHGDRAGLGVTAPARPRCGLEQRGWDTGVRGEGILLSAPAQGLSRSRGGRGAAQPRWPPPAWACRLPKRPTGRIPRPVYHEGSMSGSARGKPRARRGLDGREGDGALRPRGRGWEHQGSGERGRGGEKLLQRLFESRPVLQQLLTPQVRLSLGMQRGLEAGGGWGESLTHVLLTPDFHGALTDAAVAGGQGQADEQQPQEAGDPQLHPQHFQAAVTWL